MKPRIKPLAWLCAAVGLSVAPLEAQEAKPADKPAAEISKADVPPAPQRRPQENAPPNRDQPRRDQSNERTENNQPRTENSRESQRRPQMDGQRENDRPRLEEPRQDGQRGSANLKMESNRGRDNGDRPDGFHRPQGQPNGDARQHNQPEQQREGDRGPVNPPHDPNRGREHTNGANRGNERGSAQQNHERGRFDQQQNGFGPNYSTQRGGLAFRAPQQGPQHGEMQHRGPGMMEHGPEQRFEGRHDSQQFSSPGRGGNFERPLGPAPQFNQQRGQQPQLFSGPRHDNYRHQPEGPQHFESHSKRGGDRGPQPQGGPGFVPPMQGREAAPRGPQSPMNHERGPSPQPVGPRGGERGREGPATFRGV